MKYFFQLLFVCLILSGSVNAQQHEPIFGTWRVVKVNNGVTYDILTGHLNVNNELSEMLLGRPDSIYGIQMFTSMALKYTNYKFIFRNDWMYQEVMDGVTRNAASVYYLLKEENLIYMRDAMRPDQPEQTMIYEFRKDSLLDLTITTGEMNMVLTLLREEK